jgi:hypothetical protein
VKNYGFEPRPEASVSGENIRLPTVALNFSGFKQKTRFRMGAVAGPFFAPNEGMVVGSTPEVLPQGGANAHW